MEIRRNDFSCIVSDIASTNFIFRFVEIYKFGCSFSLRSASTYHRGLAVTSIQCINNYYLNAPFAFELTYRKKTPKLWIIYTSTLID